MKHRKYDDDKIRKILKVYGLILIQFDTVKDIKCKDTDGYKYKVSLSNLKLGKKPNRFMLNPFAIDNIKLYLQIYYPNYILLDDEYAGCKNKMRFLCLNHADKGIQYNTIDNIVNSHHACKYCSIDRVREFRVVPKETLIQYCAGKYVTYHGQYTKNNETYVQYTCPKHENNGVQEMSLTHFKDSKSPCKFCGITSGELKIKEYLDEHHIQYEKEKTFDGCVYKNKLRFDYYIPILNCVIEYDGAQHFRPVKFSAHQDADESYSRNVIRDKIKNDFCESNNIKIIRIPYYQYDEIYEY